MKHQKTIGKWVALLLVACLTACYENQEGCLDILATNYDVEADNQCEDCCEYPSLVINLVQQNNGESFSLGDTIINNLNLRTRVLKVVYLISNIAIVLEDEATFVSDSVRVSGIDPVSNVLDTFWLRDDFTRISRTKARYEVGELRERGYISRLEFDLGLAENVNGVVFIDNGRNDLNTDPDSLRQSDNSYIIQRLYLAVGPDLTDSTVVDVPATVGLQSVSVVLDTSFVAGKNKEINLTVDYSGWFDDIDFSDADKSEWPAKLRKNLAAGFK